MSHGRFEFDRDFSSLASRSEGKDLLHLEDSQTEDAYRTGFEDGQAHQRTSDDNKILNLLSAIENSIRDQRQWQKEQSDAVFSLIVPTFERFLSQLAKHVRIDTLIDSNQFGLRDLLNKLSPDDEPKIHISESMHKAMADKSLNQISSHLGSFIADPAIHDNDFEIRWRNGGVNLTSEDLIERYRVILSRYKQG